MCAWLVVFLALGCGPPGESEKGTRAVPPLETTLSQGDEIALAAILQKPATTWCSLCEDGRDTAVREWAEALFALRAEKHGDRRDVPSPDRASVYHRLARDVDKFVHDQPVMNGNGPQTIRELLVACGEYFAWPVEAAAR